MLDLRGHKSNGYIFKFFNVVTSLTDKKSTQRQVRLTTLTRKGSYWPGSCRKCSIACPTSLDLLICLCILS